VTHISPTVEAAPQAPRFGAAPDDVAWHGAWPLGMAAGAGLLLTAAGELSAQVLLALALMALPGIIGLIWRPRTEERFALLALWALCAALAICASGGLTGPLAALCVAPAIAGLVIGGDWRAGAGLSVAAALFCLLAGFLHLPPPPPGEPTRTWLSLVAILAAAAAAGGAALVVRRRAALEREEAEAELDAVQTLLGDLPDLALAMDAEGRTEAVFGQPLAEIDLEALHAGLVEAAAEADRPKVQAANDEARAAGAARTSFIAAGSDRPVAAALQRTAAGGLTAILRNAAPPPRPLAAPPPAAPAPSPDLSGALAAAEAARREAEIGRDQAEANPNTPNTPT
jgi:hypothetical protein